MRSAEAARCAADQGRFWEFHVALCNRGPLKLDLREMMATGHSSANDMLEPIAEHLDLNLPDFRQCLDSGRSVAEIRKDLEEGQKAGVTGTPAFILGLTASEGSQISGAKMLVG